MWAQVYVEGLVVDLCLFRVFREVWLSLSIFPRVLQGEGEIRE